VTSTFALELIRHAITTCLLVAAPLLLVALLVGVLVSLFQAVTSLQEQTLTFIPKLVAVGAVALLVLPWMMRQLIQYLVEMVRTLPMLVA
jgi:flagellar biosynthetic protein FliQ